MDLDNAALPVASIFWGVGLTWLRVLRSRDSARPGSRGTLPRTRVSRCSEIRALGSRGRDSLTMAEDRVILTAVALAA